MSVGERIEYRRLLRAGHTREEIFAMRRVAMEEEIAAFAAALGDEQRRVAEIARQWIGETTALDVLAASRQERANMRDERARMKTTCLETEALIGELEDKIAREQAHRSAILAGQERLERALAQDPTHACVAPLAELGSRICTYVGEKKAPPPVPRGFGVPAAKAALEKELSKPAEDFKEIQQRLHRLYESAKSSR